MSDLMSTLVRVIESDVLSLSVTVIFCASEPDDPCASFVNAYSTIGGGGAVITPTPITALEALVNPIIEFCLSLIFKFAGATWKTCLQVAPSLFMITPCRAAVVLTASTLSIGTDHTSVFVNGNFWLVALPARFFRAAYNLRSRGALKPAP
jgi:hypothetical protein